MIGLTNQRPKIGAPAIYPVVTDNGPANDDIIQQIERYLDAWRRITDFVGLAKAGRFDHQHEDQFLELKGMIAQELESILAFGECSSPTKDEIHAMMNNVPSLRYLSQLNAGALRNLENQWHLIYIGWHATLGQLKARHEHDRSQSRSTSFFRRALSW